MRGGADHVGAGDEGHHVQTLAGRPAQPVQDIGHRVHRAQHPRVPLDAQPAARRLLFLCRRAVPQHLRHHAPFHQSFQGYHLPSGFIGLPNHDDDDDPFIHSLVQLCLKESLAESSKSLEKN